MNFRGWTSLLIAGHHWQAPWILDTKLISAWCRLKRPSICFWHCSSLLRLFLTVKVRKHLSSKLDENISFPVLVREPWPTPSLLVPLKSSTVEIHCTSEQTLSPTAWAIDLGNDSSGFQYRTEIEADRHTLADYGIFKLETAGKPPSLRLLINDTARNNQTKILCGSILSTTMLLFGMSWLQLVIIDTAIS